MQLKHMMPCKKKKKKKRLEFGETFKLVEITEPFKSNDIMLEKF